jgi:hypothetical protein
MKKLQNLENVHENFLELNTSNAGRVTVHHQHIHIGLVDVIDTVDTRPFGLDNVLP